MTAFTCCKHDRPVGMCMKCVEEICFKDNKKLEKRISRLERIVKKGFDFEHPEISEEIKDL